MRNAQRGTRNERTPKRGALGALVLLTTVSFGAQPAGVTADAKADRDRTTLSGTVRVTLTLDGPAPLRVELPKQLLTADADTGWRIRPDGPAAVLPTPNGRQQWRQVYRLDPYTEGTPLLVTFSPVTVNGQPVTWPAVPVTVMRTVGDATATAARPVTPPEDPPPSPIPPPRAPVPVWVFALGPVCLVVLTVAWVRRRRPKPAPPSEVALKALTKLDGSELSCAEVVERVAAVLRTFIERRFAIPATKLTTAELSAAAQEQGWPVEQAEPLGALLDQCDRAKFAGDVPDDDGCRRLLRRAVDWVNDVGRPAGPR